MLPALSRQYAILGTGEPRVGHRPDVSTATLMTQACRLALADARLSPADVDGVIVESPLSSPRFLISHDIAMKLGIRPKYAGTIGLGGASPVAALSRAVAAIEAGLCNMVLFAMGDHSWSYQKGRHTAQGRLDWGYAEFEETFGLLEAPGGYALAARRHMHEYGTRAEDLGSIAVTTRYHASLNDNAQLRTPITLAEYLASRWIVEPFRLLDCSLVSDYAGAFVIGRIEEARALGVPEILIAGAAEQHNHRFVNQADLTVTGATDVAARLWAASGLGPHDVRLAQLYDSFTYTVLVQLEDYGFCEKGRGGAFVHDGRIRLDGALPVNTHGGLLSQAHAGGVLHVTEAVKQLRRACGPRQVKDADVALVTGGGGIFFAAHAGALLLRE